MGKRIVFGGTCYMRYQHESRKEGYSRTYPRFVDWPQCDVVYTLAGVGSDGRDFQFQFQREETKRRATFNLYKSDDFILNFDDAAAEDIEFYLGDRANRHHYLTSFPLLQATLRLKREEKAKEEPFVDLLVKQAAAQCGIEEREARRWLSTIIPWWNKERVW